MSSMLSEIKINSLTPNKLEKLLNWALPRRKNTMIVGPPGYGKTEITVTTALRLGYKVLLFHPVIEDPTDAKGFPFIYKDDDGNMKAEFIPFNQLKMLYTATEKTAAIFDDFGQAEQSVQKPYMQLFGDGRELNGNRVSDMVSFVVITNRREDKAGVNGILEPIKSRMKVIMNIQPDPDDLVKYMIEKEMPAELIAFTRYKPEHISIENFKPTFELNNTPCPRTVCALGQHIKDGLMDLDGLFLPVAAGTVGEGYASEFDEFMKIHNSMPDLDKIERSPDEVECPELNEKNGMALLYSIAGALSYRVTKKNVKNIFKYIDRMPIEFQVLFVKDSIVRDRGMMETDPFIQWATLNQNVLN